MHSCTTTTKNQRQAVEPNRKREKEKKQKDKIKIYSNGKRATALQFYNRVPINNAIGAFRFSIEPIHFAASQNNSNINRNTKKNENNTYWFNA